MISNTINDIEESEDGLLFIGTTNGLNILNLEKIKALLCLHVTVASSDLTSITAFNDEWRHLEEPHLSQFLYLRRDYENRFLNIIRAGIEQGEIKNINPQVLFYTILSSVRWIYDCVQKEHAFSCASLQKQFCEIILNGVAL